MSSGRAGKAIILTYIFTAGYGQLRHLGVGFQPITAGSGINGLRKKLHESDFPGTTSAVHNIDAGVCLERFDCLVIMENSLLCASFVSHHLIPYAGSGK